MELESRWNEATVKRHLARPENNPIGGSSAQKGGFRPEKRSNIGIRLPFSARDQLTVSNISTIALSQFKVGRPLNQQPQGLASQALAMGEYVPLPVPNLPDSLQHRRRSVDLLRLQEAHERLADPRAQTVPLEELLHGHRAQRHRRRHLCAPTSWSEERLMSIRCLHDQGHRDRRVQGRQAGAAAEAAGVGLPLR